MPPLRRFKSFAPGYFETMGNPVIAGPGDHLDRHLPADRDLILVVGSSVFPYYPYIPGPLLPEGAQLVEITNDPDEAARAPMGEAIVADVRLTLEALVDRSARLTAPSRRRCRTRPRARRPTR